MKNATQPVTIVVEGPKALKAYTEIGEITSQFPQINHMAYHVKEDVMILDLQDTSADNPKTKRLTIEGVRRNRDVKGIMELKFKIALDKDKYDLGLD
jgi:hypothetical protein